jgi:membrane protease YdiL (CAAX protease family)
LNSNPTPLHERNGTPPLARRPIWAACIVATCATALSYGVPESYAATVVGLCFLAATYWLTLHGDAASSAAEWGISLGGLLDPEPLDARRLLGALGRALGVAGLMSLVVFPPFWVGFRIWYRTRSEFQLPLDIGLLDAVLGQVLVIALPEEAFFRGYLQTALGRRWPPTLRVGGALVGYDVLVTSAIFALGHFATEPHPARLAVFFPSLVFGWLRARTGGIGASVAFHAACNLFASLLARGYGLHS